MTLVISPNTKESAVFGHSGPRTCCQQAISVVSSCASMAVYDAGTGGA